MAEEMRAHLKELVNLKVRKIIPAQMAKIRCRYALVLVMPPRDTSFSMLGTMPMHALTWSKLHSMI